MRTAVSDIGTTHVEGISMLTRLETMEQELIQHIRTSGVSQSREFGLIDEVMNIRTERRKVFSAMNKMVREMQQLCDDSKRGMAMKDEEISSLVAKQRSLQDINDQLLQDMADREVHHPKRYKEEDVEVRCMMQSSSSSSIKQFKYIIVTNNT